MIQQRANTSNVFTEVNRMALQKKATAKSPKNGRAASTKHTVVRSSVTGRLVVAPKSGGWAVKREGGKRTRVYTTQADAIKAATKTARDSKSGVVIHGKDGRIKQVSTSRADSLMLDVWKSARQGQGGSKNSKGSSKSYSKNG